MKLGQLVLVCLLAAIPALSQDPPKPPDASKPPETVRTTPAVEPVKTSPAAESPAPPAAASPKSAPAPDAVAKTPTPAKPPSPAELMRQAIEKQRAAVGKQREAAQKQAEAAGAWLKGGDARTTPHLEPFPRIEADCEPIADAIIAPIIESNAKSQAVKPELLRAVMEQESGYRACAISRKGAQGLMQLMPATAQEFGVADVFDPKENVAAGAKLLKQLMDKYNGDLSKALAAYNAGSATVDQAGGVPDIQETKDYVDSILKKLGATPAVPPTSQTTKPTGN
jgi:soluble lytic murein transglycosylase-like protein